MSISQAIAGEGEKEEKAVEIDINNISVNLSTLLNR